MSVRAPGLSAPFCGIRVNDNPCPCGPVRTLHGVRPFSPPVFRRQVTGGAAGRPPAGQYALVRRRRPAGANIANTTSTQAFTSASSDSFSRTTPETSIGAPWDQIAASRFAFTSIKGQAMQNRLRSATGDPLSQKARRGRPILAKYLCFPNSFASSSRAGAGPRHCPSVRSWPAGWVISHRLIALRAQTRPSTRDRERFDRPVRRPA